METCFVYECDPEAEECTGNLEEDTSYYKIVRRNAANIPLCDPEDENCGALVCPEGEQECEVILCNDETKGEEDICNDPEQYVLDNPSEDEEAIECAQDDEECLAAAENEESQCEEGDEDCASVADAADENETTSKNTDSSE